jgi:DNA invertase Pin-like site-specific DNA recombinase
MIKKSARVGKSFFKFLMLFSEMEMKDLSRSISRSKVVKSRKGKRHQRQLEAKRL